MRHRVLMGTSTQRTIELSRGTSMVRVAVGRARLGTGTVTQWTVVLVYATSWRLGGEQDSCAAPNRPLPEEEQQKEWNDDYRGKCRTV